jgi:hypothetical protein
MTWRSSIGLFGVFGRSADLRQLDDALRAVDVHPRLVPEAIKLTTVKLLKEDANHPDPPGRLYTAAAEMIGYCLLGEGLFEQANGSDRVSAVETRIERAVQTGTCLDSRLLLLALHAGIIQPSVVNRFGLNSEDA